MSTVQIETHSIPELLKTVEQLSLSELEQFVSQVLALRAKRRAPSLPQTEAELLLKINQGMPPEVQARYSELIDKREAETLTPDEYDELLCLTDQVEEVEARRLKYLTELAELRQTTLSGLMKDLKIRPFS
jgi:hypothetical protein